MSVRIKRRIHKLGGSLTRGQGSLPWPNPTWKEGSGYARLRIWGDHKTTKISDLLMILGYRLLYQVIRPLIPLLDLSHNSSLAPPQGNGTTAHTHTPHTPHHVYQPPAVYMVMSSTVFPVICLGVVIILAFLLGGLVYYYCTRWDIMVFHVRGVSHFCLKTEPPSLSLTQEHMTDCFLLWKMMQSCSWLVYGFLTVLLPQTFANVCHFVLLCVP